MGKINHDDLFDKDGLFGKELRDLKNLKELFDLFVKNSIKDAKRLSDELADVNITGDPEDIKKAEAALESVNKATEEHIQIQKKQATVDQEIIKLNIKRAKIAKSTGKSLAEQRGELRRLRKEQKSTIKGADRLNDLLETLEENGKGNSKSAKGLRKEVKKLNKELDVGEAKISAAGIELSELNKVQKLATRDSLKLVGAYEKQSRRLNDLRKEWKDLAAQNLDNSDQANVLLTEIQELDTTLKNIDGTVGQNQRNVGNYTDSLVAAAQQTGFLSKITGFATEVQQQFAVITGLVSSSLDKETIVKNKNAIATKKMSVGNRLAAKGLKALRIGAVAAVAALLAIGAAAAKSLAGTQAVADEAEELGARLGTAVDVVAGAVGQNLLGSFNQFRGGLNFIFGDVKKGQEQVLRGLQQTTGSFDNLGDKIVAADKATLDLVRSQRQFRIDSREIRLNIVALTEEEETRRAIADDATRSFKEREDAARQARKATQGRVNEELKLRQKELEFADAEVKRGEILAANNIATNDLLDKQLEAQLALAEAESAAAVVAIENEKQRRELVQDRLEKDLDILIDGFDNQKTINERLIADDRKTLEEREKIFKDTIKLSNISFQKQSDVISQFAQKNVDVNSLVQESDAEVLRQRIRNLGLSEIVEGRLLEIIRERRIVLQDIADLQRTLGDERLAQLKEAEQIELSLIEDKFDKEIQIREVAFQEQRLQLLENTTISEEKRAELIKALRKKLDKEISELEDEKANEAISNQEKIAAARIDQQVKDFDNEKEFQEFRERELTKIKIDAAKKRLDLLSGIEGKAAEVEREELKAQIALLEAQLDKANVVRLKKLAQNSVDIVEELAAIDKKSSDARIKRIDEDLKENEDRQSSLRAAAENGQKDALASLQQLEKQEAALRTEKNAALERQKRIEIGLAAINLLNSKIQSGDKNAVANTAKDILKLIGLLQGLPKFYGGTTNVGESLGRPVLKGRDAYPIRVHGTERIFSGDQNKRIPKNMDNETAANILRDAASGKMMYASEFDNPTKSVRVERKDTDLIRSIDGMHNSIKALPGRMPTPEMDVDAVTGIVTTLIKTGNRIERTRKKLPTIFKT